MTPSEIKKISTERLIFMCENMELKEKVKELKKQIKELKNK